MALQANWIETYVNAAGKNIFVYVISGPQDEVKAFVRMQGEHHRETEDGRPKYYAPFYGGRSVKMELNYAKNGYNFINSDFHKARSLASQFGGNAYIVFAEIHKDLNWLLYMENEMSEPRNKIKITAEEQKSIDKLKKQLAIRKNTEVDKAIRAQKNNYIVESFDNKGHCFLNEWHFAAKVVEEIGKSPSVAFTVLKHNLEGGATEFNGTLQDSEGNKYTISEDESQWMFRELLTIFQLTAEFDLENKRLVIKKAG